jgi:hypothetical protein
MREELNVPLVRQTHSVSSGPSNISPLPHPMTTSQPPVLVTKVATSHFGGSSGWVVISRPGGPIVVARFAGTCGCGVPRQEVVNMGSRKSRCEVHVESVGVLNRTN